MRILNYFAAGMIIVSSNMFACEFDFVSMKTACDNAGKDLVLINCTEFIYGRTSPTVVACLDNAFPTDLQNRNATCSNHMGAIYDLKNYMTCESGETPPVLPKIMPNKPVKICGSVINKDTLTFTESIPLSGLSFDLVYSSDKVRGRKENYQALIPLTHPTQPIVGSLTEKMLTTQIAGKNVTTTFAPTTGMTYLFEWDGKDHLGNTL